MGFITNASFCVLIFVLFMPLFGITIEIDGVEENVNSPKNQLTPIGSIAHDNISLNNDNSSRLINSSIILPNISSLQWTGSIKVNGDLDQTVLEKVKIDMCMAGIAAEKAVGVSIDPMQSNTSAKLAVENGFLIYRVGVTDGDKKYIIIVNPEDGSVLNIQPTDVILDTGMSMMYKCMVMSSNQTATSSGNGMTMMH